MKMMSKKMYLGFYAASLLLFLLSSIPILILLIVDVLMEIHEYNGYRLENFIAPLLLLVIFGYVQFLIVQTIYVFLILSRMWGAIQDGQTLITVGKAIGYLFIPFFNIYWIFKAWGGFPTEYNNYIDRYGLPAPRLSGGVYTIYPVLLLLTAFLYVPVLLLPFVFLALIAKTCDAVNALGNAVTERRIAVTQN